MTEGKIPDPQHCKTRPQRAEREDNATNSTSIISVERKKKKVTHFILKCTPFRQKWYFAIPAYPLQATMVCGNTHPSHPWGCKCDDLTLTRYQKQKGCTLGGEKSEKMMKVQHEKKRTLITPGRADTCDFRSDATTLDLFCDLRINQPLQF